MNQTQRNYIIKELQATRNSKIRQVEKDESNNDTNVLRSKILSEIAKEIKDGKLTLDYKTQDDSTYCGLQSITDEVYMLKLVKRGYAKISEGGYVTITNGELFDGIIEMSASMMAPKTTQGFNSLVATLKRMVTEKTYVVSLTKGTDKMRKRLDAIKDAYKETERAVMLLDSEEMIDTIEAFDNRTF